MLEILWHSSSSSSSRLSTALIKQKWCFFMKKTCLIDHFQRSILVSNHLVSCTPVLPTHFIKFPHSFTHRSINALFKVDNSWDGWIIFFMGMVGNFIESGRFWIGICDSSTTSGSPVNGIGCPPKVSISSNFCIKKALVNFSIFIVL